MAAATLALTTTAIDATAAQLKDRKDEQDIKREENPIKGKSPKLKIEKESTPNRFANLQAENITAMAVPL